MTLVELLLFYLAIGVAIIIIGALTGTIEGVRDGLRYRKENK